MTNLLDRWNHGDAHQYLARVGRMPPTIICVACNGGIQGKESNPNLPETPEEIADVGVRTELIVIAVDTETMGSTRFGLVNTRERRQAMANMRQVILVFSACE